MPPNTGRFTIGRIDECELDLFRRQLHLCEILLQNDRHNSHTEDLERNQELEKILDELAENLHDPKTYNIHMLASSSASIEIEILDTDGCSVCEGRKLIRKGSSLATGEDVQLIPESEAEFISRAEVVGKRMLEDVRGRDRLNAVLFDKGYKKF